MNRADILRGREPELVVDLSLFATELGGRGGPILPGWGCPCTVQATQGAGWIGWDGWPLLDRALDPGEIRRVGYVFLSGQEAVDALSTTGTFYLWEGRLIGEAKIVAGGT